MILDNDTLDQPERVTVPAVDGSVTVVVSRCIRPEKVAEFEQWEHGINHAMEQFPGFLGVNVIKPADHAGPEYVAIFRFDQYDNLRRWEDSDVCRDWMARVEPLSTEQAQREIYTGLEYWFTMPGVVRPASAPPRLKMAVVTWLAITPLVYLQGLALGFAMDRFPEWVAFCLGSWITVLIMTYALMPTMTRLFAWWLFPRRR